MANFPLSGARDTYIFQAMPIVKRTIPFRVSESGSSNEKPMSALYTYQPDGIILYTNTCVLLAICIALDSVLLSGTV